MRDTTAKERMATVRNRLTLVAGKNMEGDPDTWNPRFYFAKTP
jgi:hypothetical protein